MAVHERKPLSDYVIVACGLAATYGLSYGYSIGISGITAMKVFHRSFFPNSIQDLCSLKQTTSMLWFTSSLYLAGFVACFPASFVIQAYGKRASIMLAGLSCISGAALTSTAQNMTMLIVGRVMMGVGAAFGNQAVPVYVSEMAPAEHREHLNFMFQLLVTYGISSGCVAIALSGTGETLIPGAWRVLLGVAGMFGVMTTVVASLLPDTPHDLVKRGHQQQARSELARIRSTTESEVETEYASMEKASRLLVTRMSGIRLLFRQESTPQLMMAVMIPFFQQFTGIGVITSIALLMHVKGSIFPGILITFVNSFGTILPWATMDRLGRRFFFLRGGFIMFFSLVALGLFGGGFPHTDIISVALLCLYICGFACSWGALGWLIPSEIFPMETRSAGQAVAVASNMLCTFVVAHFFPRMMCRGVFLFFAGWVLVMTAFVYWLVPETQAVPMEDITSIWQMHWFWKRFYKKGLKVH